MSAATFRSLITLGMSALILGVVMPKVLAALLAISTTGVVIIRTTIMVFIPLFVIAALAAVFSSTQRGVRGSSTPSLTEAIAVTLGLTKSSSEPDAVEDLKEQYAEGEITMEELEERLEKELGDSE